jgi:hypothetical protein
MSKRSGTSTTTAPASTTRPGQSHPLMISAAPAVPVLSRANQRTNLRVPVQRTLKRTVVGLVTTAAYWERSMDVVRPL